jgi:hypothetical protein
MAEYRPRQGPEYQDPNLKELVKWVEGEFQKLARTQQEVSVLPLQVLHVEPAKPREGNVVFADGTDWDPGFGDGPYAYMGGAWIKLFP